MVTRFEMQQFCPDILITNYSMLEYLLFRPRKGKIWADTQAWLEVDRNNKLLFVIDEALHGEPIRVIDTEEHTA